MGSTRLLTNIIQRKVMLPEEMSPSMQCDNFEVALTDFEKHPIIKCLFKADNQRSTECWSVQEIANFIEDCTEDQNINLCILYWKDIHSNIYIIDGAHRLSCIYAWIAKAVGGQGVLENGLLVHPICNRMKSDLSLEEIRADLFGELLY
ncbi:hypothetical protein QM274_06895 [Acinetobacter baumannii]|uniref:hypothetical protein n=1 Tax=Acinetobacter baumannii TaxID=470 RepID=UPI0024B83F29|nr:hypothetical protein [Acinetobacter baumannii]MDI9751939.1 hypothetical protein [Acinetobacter baumannii]